MFNAYGVGTAANLLNRPMKKRAVADPADDPMGAI
jgi:hypothetical protein